MPDATALGGKTCLVTGASDGIGKETALGLARMGARVVMVGRNPDKTEKAAAEIRTASGNPKVDVLIADLSSQAAIRKLAREFNAKYDRLDVLVNNAGGAFVKRETTVDGLEMTFALDHLNYFLLTHLVLDKLKASAPARVVNVSSGAQAGGKLNFDDLQAEKRYSGTRAYFNAKLANVMFTYELARRLSGTGVTANVLHPGTVSTQFLQNQESWLKRGFNLVRRLFLSPAQGALTSIYLASSPEVENVSGKFFVKCRPRKSSARSYDEAAQKRLWEVSERLTGLASS